ncbi:MAG: hypothetical protein ACLQBB_11605 [Solirubrobacteraceae bacterium]
MTVLTPIVDGRESSLARCLDSLGDGPSSPLSRVPGTHLARWVIIGDVVYEGAGQRRVDHLSHGRLLFSSNFDGEILPYLERLRAGLGDVADTIWGHCVGYPGHTDGDAFGAYLRAHQVDCSLFFAAYGNRTVEDVTQSLATRRAVIDFAMGAQGMAGGELRDAFLEAFGA